MEALVMNLFRFLTGMTGAIALTVATSLPILAQSSAPGAGQGQTAPSSDFTPSPAPSGGSNDPSSNTNQGSPNASPAATGNSTVGSLNLEAIVRQNTSFEVFNALLKVADLEEDLSTSLAGDESYTVFAPTDEAFAALPPGTVKMLVQPENRDLLVRILSYHIVPKSITSTAIQPGQVESLEGENLSVQSAGGSVTVNGATVIQPDIQASNGVIHAINRVILPPELQGRLTSLVPQPAVPNPNPAF